MSGPSATDEQKTRFVELMRDIAVAKERASATTLSQFTNAELADNDGRWKKQQQIVGQRPKVDYPPLPASSPWSIADPSGLEPPLGISVAEAPIVGEPHEVQRSLSSTQRVRGDNCVDSDPTKPSGGEGAGGEIVDPISVSPPSLRRRKL
jgi:hypothetical protein